VDATSLYWTFADAIRRTQDGAYSDYPHDFIWPLTQFLFPSYNRVLEFPFPMRNTKTISWDDRRPR
jgi:hypothetical protein